MQNPANALFVEVRLEEEETKTRSMRQPMSSASRRNPSAEHRLVVQPILLHAGYGLRRKSRKEFNEARELRGSDVNESTG
jgi:hypothetical protein